MSTPKSAAAWGSTPIMTNSVVPMPKAPMASASSATGTAPPFETGKGLLDDLQLASGSSRELAVGPIPSVRLPDTSLGQKHHSPAHLALLQAAVRICRLRQTATFDPVRPQTTLREPAVQGHGSGGELGRLGIRDGEPDH